MFRDREARHTLAELEKTVELVASGLAELDARCIKLEEETKALLQRLSDAELRMNQVSTGRALSALKKK